MRGEPGPRGERSAGPRAGEGQAPVAQSAGRGAAVVVVVGDKPRLWDEGNAAPVLRQLGAEVRTLDFWDEPLSLWEAGEGGPRVRAIVVEGGDRPDVAILSLRGLRKDPQLAHVPALLAVPERQVTRVELQSGFDDFIVLPYFPAELYARIRRLEWQKSEFLTEERVKVGGLVIDRAGREVSLDGRRVSLTAKEFSLLAFLAQNRGRVFPRPTLLARVWGPRYEGGARTVDIHVRRLRAKLGDALPLETRRGAGYVLRGPGEEVRRSAKPEPARGANR